MSFCAAMVLLLAAASAPAVSVEVSGGGSCPAAEEIQRELAGVLRARGGDGGTSNHRVRLTEGSAGVRVELLSPEGGVLATRALPAAGSCADLSVAAAVIVATWETDLDAGLGGPPSVDSIGSGDRAVGSLAPVGVSTSSVSAAPVPRSERPLRFDAGLGLVTSVAGGAVAAGARIEGRLAPFDRRLGLAMVLSAIGARAATVGQLDGVAQWSRATLGAGPEYRFGGAPRTLDLHLFALAAALKVGGVDLPSTHSEITRQLGLGAGARAGWSWGTAMAWVGVDGQLFPGRDTLAVDGIAATGLLPRFELQFAVGLSLGRFP